MTTVLLAGCGSDSASDVFIVPTDKAEIKVYADIWQMMDGTRATTFDNAAAIQAEGSFTACCDEFTFQGFTDIAESEFKDLIDKTHVIYALRSRKAAQEIELAVEAKKQTQSFESLDSSATAG